MARRCHRHRGQLPARPPPRPLRRRQGRRDRRHHRGPRGRAREPPHPRWIAEKYAAPASAQLFRVYVRPDHRRAGLARALVRLAVDFVAADPAYTALYLHTDARVPGAEPFWRSLATEVHDARDGDDRTPETVHFEIPLRR
ncbi:GNAT family N-acetyltransferase [Actinokineospora soli]|uniref:GNAT family N-acetyltransferase n=1 Tax=Actinokineospora soli TaxID=1048753 RepID=A0ABW2TSR2_9PSEU